MNINQTAVKRKRVIPKPKLPKEDEDGIQARLVKRLRLAGCKIICTDMMIALGYLGKSKQRRINFYNYSVKRGYTKGQPDFIAIGKGKVAFVETKRWDIGTRKTIINQTKQEDEQIEFEKFIKEQDLPYFLINCPEAEQKLYEFFM